MTSAELDDRLAELLTSYSLAPPAVLERARAFQTARSCTLAGALCELHLIAEDLLWPMLEELTGVRAVNPSLMTVYPDFVARMVQLVPPEVVSRLLIFPAQMEINTIHVCMLNPTDGWTTRALESLSGCRVEPLVTHEPAVLSAIERHYAEWVQAPLRFNGEDGRATVERVYRSLLDRSFEDYVKPAVSLVNRNRDAIGRDPKALESIIREPSIIRLVQQIIARAVEAGASDIHIEPMPEMLRVRVRIDGAMQVSHVLPPTTAAPIIARLKAMADASIEPAAEPIDGRIGYDLVWGRGVDLRFSMVPAIGGETIVLRVLDRLRERRSLADLGVDQRTRSAIESASDLPNGLLLVTGPTGSGKSSTLYALLDRLNEDDVCILTAEDPIESRIKGVTQVYCEDGKGMTFASALRSFLRQDPDVLMVGEIRDTETADIALKAALTGHLVLSTLHTNDAPGAVLRLINMNLEPFLIASALRLIVAQRLIRRLCSACKSRIDLNSDDGRSLLRACPQSARQWIEDGSPFAPVGCTACNESGYKGRTGIFEVLTVSNVIEELIIARASAADIRAEALAQGMQTLRLAGLRKVAAGETSLAEVLQHTIAEADQPVVGSQMSAQHV